MNKWVLHEKKRKIKLTSISLGLHHFYVKLQLQLRNVQLEERSKANPQAGNAGETKLRLDLVCMFVFPFDMHMRAESGDLT